MVAFPLGVLFVLKPRSSRSPAGLVLPGGHAHISGFLRWSVLDERGVPEVPRTPSGVPIASADGVYQKNLLTNLGLDAMGGTRDVFSTDYRRYLHIGTSSVEPDVTDVALGNEVQRSSTGSSPSTSYTKDTENEVFRADVTVTRDALFTADRNLTEFGLGWPDDTSVYIRELFRDEFGDPVTISILNGKTLRVNHTLRIELAAPASGTAGSFTLEQYDATNTLVSSTPYTGVYGIGVPANYIGAFSAWNPISVSYMGYISSSWTYTLASQPPGGVTTSSLVPQTYVGGTYERLKKGTMAAGAGNTTWHGLAASAHSSSITGHVFTFDSPLTYTKPNTDTVEFSVISSWSRPPESSS